MTALLLEAEAASRSHTPAIKPSGAIVRYARIVAAEPPKRHTVMRIWGHGRRLVWIVARAGRANGQIDDLEVRRIIGWSYQAGYAGCLIGSLYPAVTRSLAASRAWNLEGGRQALDDTIAAAQDLGHMARLEQCRDGCIATGPLIATEKHRLALFVEMMRLGAPRVRRWHALGTDANGWPLPPVRSGRPMMPARCALQPWEWPRDLLNEDPLTQPMPRVRFEPENTAAA